MAVSAEFVESLALDDISSITIFGRGEESLVATAWVEPTFPQTAGIPAMEYRPKLASKG
jgi:hypothetical protein